MKWSDKITYLYGVYNGTRMLIGAVNTFFLLNMGVSMGNVALLQMIQTFTVLIMEVPTGVIADVVSRKLSMVLSCGLLVLYYPLICFGAPNMLILGIGQFIYALALCLVSGAFEGWQTLLVKKEYPGEDQKLNYYGHLKYEINSFVTMISGTLGAIILYIHGGGYVILFSVCSISMLLLCLGFIKIPYGNVDIDKHQVKSLHNKMSKYIDELKVGCKCCFSNINGWCYFLGYSLLVCSYQVVYFYWQPYFSILATENSGSIWMLQNNELLLGIVFFVYCFTRFIMNRFVRKTLLDKINPFTIAMWCLTIAIICSIGFSFLRGINIIIHISLFAIIQGTITLVESIFMSQFIKKTDNKNVSCSLSITSAATTILSIFVLAFMSRTITEEKMYLFFFATVFIYALLLIITFIWNYKYSSLIIEK